MAFLHKNINKKRRLSDKTGDRILTFLLYPLRLFLFYFLFQIVFRIMFKLKHRLKYNKNGFKLPKTPFIVLGNHVTDWDGLYLNTFFKRFIYFLVHDELYKYKFRKIIAYNLFGQIKRGKFKNDIGPLRKLTELKNAKKCIGIFPEGDITYAGKSLEVNKSIAKLCKILDMPIVLVRIDGATYQRPRWSYEVRNTPISLNITDVISCEDVKKSDYDTLYDRIVNGIKYDDNQYQIVHHNKMKAKKPAECLEYVLFLCPDCGKINCLKSTGEMFYCTNCGYKVKYNLYNQFELLSGKRYFLNIGQWDEYQKSKIADVVKSCKIKGTEIISFNNFSYNKVNIGEYFYKPSNSGTLYLNHERIKFVSDDGSIIQEYNLNDIKDLYVQFKGAVEFSHAEFRYRFISKKGQHYGYWFECFINNILHNSKGD